jgi:hypothetical protein
MYIVIELQTDANGHVANIVTAYDNYPQAQQKFYTICAAAAVSDVPVHSAVILDNTGRRLASESFNHDIVE